MSITLRFGEYHQSEMGHRTLLDVQSTMTWYRAFIISIAVFCKVDLAFDKGVEARRMIIQALSWAPCICSSRTYSPGGRASVVYDHGILCCDMDVSRVKDTACLLQK